MTQDQVRFNDGAAYERMMGAWSRLAGEVFLDWLAPSPGLRWLDVGCGSGAFTELLVERCLPTEIQGVDLSEDQLVFARTRHTAGIARFQRGDAMALPFADDRFDAAVMALVIAFVPNPQKGVAEMARAVRPGGTVAAYVWDITNGGSPTNPLWTELRAAGHPGRPPPRAEASRLDALRALWAGAGLEATATRQITVSRTFVDFKDYWTGVSMAPTVAPTIAAMAPAEIVQLKARLRTRLAPDAAGRVTYASHANAIIGRVPV